ncbi:hypothetical protein F4810DRAFT_709769 [Camillea tinctor]|nr:hypothetical protein F4810DRAFT_709769 [Camillea tinctor]
MAISILETQDLTSDTRVIHQDGMILSIKMITSHTSDSSPPVSGPCISHVNERPVSLRVIPELLAHLPALQSLDCPFLWERTIFPFDTKMSQHYTRPWEGLRRDERHEFAGSMRDIEAWWPNGLKTARLLFWHGNWFVDEDQEAQMPNLVHPFQEDPTSAAVRTLTARLEELDLCAFLMPDIFSVPHRGEDPHPMGFEITAAHYPPEASNPEDEMWDDVWNYQGGRMDNIEPKTFRTEPIPEAIEPLLAGFLRAVADMPRLKDAELFTYLNWCPTEEMEAEYGDEALYND